MSRAAVVLGLTVVLSPLLATEASAQQPGAGPPMPMAVDLSKAPIGAWADYTMTVATMPPMKMRMALVSRSDKGTPTYGVETQVEGGAMSASKMTMQTSLAGTGSDIKVQKMVMQMGNNDPMELPLDPAMARQFQKPDPKTLVKEETVKVAAGSYKTKHYRQKSPQGDVFDFWVSDTVPPYGVVKMEGEQKSNPAVKGKLKMELTATGKDAKPSITKPAKPFDQAALMQQMMGAKGGPGKAPPAPAPAPAPAK